MSANVNDELITENFVLNSAIMLLLIDFIKCDTPSIS